MLSTATWSAAESCGPLRRPRSPRRGPPSTVSVELDDRRGRRTSEPPAVGLEGVPGPATATSIAWIHAAKTRGTSAARGSDRRGVEPRRVDGRQPELVAGHQGAQEAGVGGQPEDAGGVERLDQRAPGGLAVGAVGDHLAEHRVVRRADDLPALERLVDADLRGRRASRTNQVGGARLREEPAEGVLGVDPRLDRVAGDDDVVLAGTAAARRPRRRAGACTRSRPVTASVTGCSTWRRVFISRK